jgi:hypothetical protein
MMARIRRFFNYNPFQKFQRKILQVMIKIPEIQEKKRADNFCQPSLSLDYETDCSKLSLLVLCMTFVAEDALIRPENIDITVVVGSLGLNRRSASGKLHRRTIIDARPDRIAVGIGVSDELAFHTPS